MIKICSTIITFALNILSYIFFRRFNSGGALFADFQSLQRVWTHPIVLRLNAEKVEKANEKKFTSDSEGSLKDFINDNSTGSDSSSHDSSSDSDIQAIDEQKENVPRRKTRNNPGDPGEFSYNIVLYNT